MMLNTSVLFGEDFEYMEEAHIEIAQGKTNEVDEGYVPGAFDYKKYFVMPSFFNAHTHIGDSFAKEAALGLDVSKAVGRKGVKWKLYQNSSRSERISAMRETLEYLLSSGTTGFSEFREHGLDGIEELKTALGRSRMKSIILGRDVDESECDGLGLNLYQTEQIPKKRGKILALHAGEKEGEIEKAFEWKPDVIVHFTKAKTAEIKEAAKRNISIVVCPRSNSLLSVGFPKVKEMLKAKINVSIGTDNVMLNQPNMFREMEYLSKLSYLFRKPIKPEGVLRMATYNGARAFKINSGLVKKGMNADLIFIDKNALNLRHTRSMAAAVVHRCEPENVRKV
ncbi:MAG: amidohydrolase family protein, partial [Candidatus Altiarchaeota archaeon]